MLTDLHLQKYLDGLLSPEESREVEKMLEGSPEMRARLQALRDTSEVIGKPLWKRLREERRDDRGSRVRYAILLPALLLLILVLVLGQHWFTAPGSNPTFTRVAGDSDALELLVDSPQGWRYFGARYHPGDSLSFAVQATARDSFRVMLWGVDLAGSPRARKIWDGGARRFGPGSVAPVFRDTTPGEGGAPAYFVLLFSAHSAEAPESAQVARLAEKEHDSTGLGPWHFQVLATGS